VLIDGLEAHFGVSVGGLQAATLVQPQETAFDLRQEEEDHQHDLLGQQQAAGRQVWPQRQAGATHQQERQKQDPSGPKQREQILSDEIGARCAEQIQGVDDRHAPLQATPADLIADILAQTVGDEERQEEPGEDQHLREQALELDIEQVGAQIIEILASQHGQSGKKHRPLKAPKGFYERGLGDLEQIGPEHGAERKADEQQVEEQRRHDEKGKQPKQRDGEQHRGEGQNEESCPQAP
jgi:hypothetical protein